MVLKKIGLIILLLLGFTKAYTNCTTGVVLTPIIDSISVDIAGNVTICWQPVSDADGIFQYYIYKPNLLTGANDRVDSVLFGGGNCYTFLAGSNNSDIDFMEIGVVAVDVCNNPSGPINSNYTNTMFLESNFDPCAASIILNWNAYDDFTSGTTVLYGIYLSINSAAYTLVATSSTENFTYLSVNQGDNYEFFVRAIENFGAGPFTSSSNDVAVITSAALKVPVFNYLYAATVIDSTEIGLQFYVDTAADINSYRITRTTSLRGTYQQIGSVNAFLGMNPFISFTDDNDVEANKTPYYYIIEPINICGVVSNPSDTTRTIWVDVVSTPIDAINTITITSYEGWLGNVEKYELFRAIAGVWETNPIATFSAFSDTLVYVDDITTAFEGDGEYCYRVDATQKLVALVGGLQPATSLSNEACALHEPLLYVPNAFVPDGIHNTAFKPILTFANPDEYLFQIYNKWGQIIFETQEVDRAWNGRFNNSGEMNPVGSYVYVIKFLSATGENFSKRGVVTLIN